MFDKDYFNGKTSNYLLGYELFNYKFRWNSRINRLLSFKNSGKLLDVGCAYGYFLKFINDKFDVYGIDISKHAVRKAKKIVGPNRIKRHDIQRKIPFNKRFDVITAFDVIEHLPKQLKALHNIYNALKKNGLVFLEMPLKYNSKRFKFLFYDRDKTHNNLLSYRESISLIKKAGFKVISETNILAPFVGLVKIKVKKPKNFIYFVLKK